jgi:hypothetical protein
MLSAPLHTSLPLSRHIILSCETSEASQRRGAGLEVSIFHAHVHVHVSISILDIDLDLAPV